MIIIRWLPESTPVERQVAEVAARGRTNREIAVRLHCERPAQNHVQYILTELDCRTGANAVGASRRPEG